MIFKKHELPIAYSMIAAADRVRVRRDGQHPFEKYFLLWTAFKNIYTTIASRQGRRTQIIIREDGTVETCTNGNVKIPKIKTVSEREQIHLALEEFEDKLKRNLIMNESTKFFVSRIPYWNGTQIEHDAFGQRLNGVINVSYTTNMDYPIWSPIDTQIFERFSMKPDQEEDRDFLTRQIVDLLFTVSKNLMHISKKFDDGNDMTVIENALPLLRMIVAAFTQ